MTSPLLWQNEDQTISLIDIPYSIIHAQGEAQNPCYNSLISSQPLQTPFFSNEPKSALARANLHGSETDDEEIHELLTQACVEVRKHHSGSWCYSRPFVEDAPRLRKKRKLSAHPEETLTSGVHEPTSVIVPTEIPLPDGYLSKLAHQDVTFRKACMKFEEDDDIQVDDHGLSWNHSRKSHALSLEEKTVANATYRFHIPPNSTFYLADCHDSRSFHHAIRGQAEEARTRRHFDFILLDPPWPNRSVKRTHKTAGSTYSTLATVSDVQRLITSMDLDMLMADQCFVAVWVTNKAAVRDSVLSADGLFACWGVDLVEEWIWLKTTTEGEPVTALESVWRKPYEVLLLGRRRRVADVSKHEEMKRRVIIGVPDLHSRKPCIKRLVEPLLPDQRDYRALEIFARHLVAGWWSWGDECIKYNWEGYWKTTKADESQQ